VVSDLQALHLLLAGSSQTTQAACTSGAMDWAMLGWVVLFESGVGAAGYSGEAGHYMFRSHADNQVKVSAAPLEASRCAKGGNNSRRILKKTMDPL
jgi:hypothetical protein